MNVDLINEFYNKSTPEDKVQFLWLIARDIVIPVTKVNEDGTKDVECMNLDTEIPVVMNGISYQFNLEGFFDEEREKEKKKNEGSGNNK